MQTKLTLRIEDQLIRRAKAWAELQGVSLSGTVAAFFARLPENTESLELSPWTRHLAGAAAGDGVTPSDGELRDDHLRHLEEKHR